VPRFFVAASLRESRVDGNVIPTKGDVEKPTVIQGPSGIVPDGIVRLKRAARRQPTGEDVGDQIHYIRDIDRTIRVGIA
jgi:hypothetical protein